MPLSADSWITADETKRLLADRSRGLPFVAYMVQPGWSVGGGGQGVNKDTDSDQGLNPPCRHKSPNLLADSR